MRNDIIQIIAAALPTFILLCGGQLILNFYLNKQKKKENRLLLVKSVREKQYEAIEKLYILFSKFMELYRITHEKTHLVDLKDEKARSNILYETIKAEADIEALIIRIGVEFGSYGDKNRDKQLTDLLGTLRQSVHKWRNHFKDGKELPFGKANQIDYILFKESFVRTAAFLMNEYYSELNAPRIDEHSACNIVINAFDNKFESIYYQNPPIND